MDELSKSFGFPETEDDNGLDVSAIFKSADDPSADLLSPFAETESEPAVEDIPAAVSGNEAEESESAGGPVEPASVEEPESKDEETKPAAKPAKQQESTAEPAKMGKPKKSDAAQPSLDIFSAFNSDNAPPPPVLEIVPKTEGQASLFDRPPVFSYGGHKDKIEDASQTFEELRIAKADDFPELEDGKTVSWRVKYGEVTKYVDKPREKTIASVKEEIEKSKQFLDALKKGKAKDPDCLVIPTVTAKSKGIADYKGVFPTVEAARESDKLICLLPAKDGQIYEMRKTEMGEFIAPKNNVVDFATVRAGFTPALPPIPRELMGQIISFFRCFMNKREEYEALAYIYWDRQEEEFTVFVPKQTATKSSIHADMQDNTLPEDRYLLYADVHSHNSMAAKFSPVDDQDERATRLYVVIGKLDRFYPQITARVSCGGTYMQIDPGIVMEGIGEEFPVEWLDQVTRERVLDPWPTLYPASHAMEDLL